MNLLRECAAAFLVGAIAVWLFVPFSPRFSLGFDVVAILKMLLAVAYVMAIGFIPIWIVGKARRFFHRNSN
jgi:hypothetical protein